MTSDRRRRAATIMFTLLVLLPGLVAAQSRASTVVGRVYPDTGADTTIEPILREFVRLDLAIRGIRFVAGGGDDRADLETLYQAAAAQGAAYAFTGVYIDRGTEIELRLALYDATAREKVSESRAAGQIDLSLDRVVSEAIDSVLDDIVLAPDPLPLGATGVTTAATTGSSDQPSTLADPVEGTTTAPLVATSGETGGLVSEPPPVMAPPARFRRLGISTGAAPLIVTGDTASFAKLGLLATAVVSYRIPVGPGSLGLGMLSGFAWLRATGLVATADVRLVPLAVDALYTPFDDLSFGLSLHLSAGAALMSISTTYAGVLTKAVPFALAGMQVGFPLGSALRVEVQACFAAFLEPSLPILAFAPEVLLWLRL